MPTQERIKELLAYDQNTGMFVWRVAPSRRVNIGMPAGCINSRGYVRIKIDGRLYMAHRLAWLYMTGEWPDEEVDHINRNSADNRWINLRAANRSQNMGNISKNRNNTSGVKGVCWDKKRGMWQARLQASARFKHLGHFADINDAAAAYADAARKHFGRFANPVLDADELLKRSRNARAA
ncbi:HNH endonuclease signature motif containing protein [Azospirillum sp. A26]|uniref:HNH endonuclease signature motif containing protein n=1 Tax=Azospirillum sp. A26 TaxID=3160607 RepID=UPI003670969C